MPPEAPVAPLPPVPARPLVTVAIPADKGAAFIRATMESVLAQTLINRCVRAGTNLIGEPGCGLYRRPLAAKISDFDAVNPYVVDLDYWFRLLKTGHAYYLDTPLSAFRLSRGSWSVAIGSAQSTDFTRFIGRISATPGFAPSAIDRSLGRLRAPLYSFLRAAFYKLWLATARQAG
jgi:hypothetical protein